MRLPTMVEVRQLAWVISLFFLMSGLAQYLFVQYQNQAELEANSDDDAASINKEVAFHDRVDTARYNTAYIEASNYIILLRGGEILDSFGVGNYLSIGQLLPAVHCPLLIPDMFEHPVPVSYQTVNMSPEQWRLYAKKIEGATLIVGFSAFDDVKEQDKKLVDAAHLSGILWPRRCALMSAKRQTRCIGRY